MTKTAAVGERGPDPGTDVAQALLAPGPPSRAMQDHSEGMAYLDTLPKRVVTVYIPLVLIMIVLLFPFYWMVAHRHQTGRAASRSRTLQSVFRHGADLQAHLQASVRDRLYPRWLWNTMFISVAATLLSLFASVLAAYAITRIRYRGANYVGAAIFLAYLVPPSILFIPLSTVIHQYGLFDSVFALILVYPTILIPFSTWLLDGVFQDHPGRAGGMRPDGRREPMADPHQDHHPVGGPGMISASIFALTLCWNEFIYALTFISSSSNKTVPVAIVNEFVDGDIYRWGSLMAGALVGSLPLVVLYSFFVEHYVAAMTGAVKE